MATFDNTIEGKMVIKDINEYVKKSPLYGPFKSICHYRGVLHPKIMFIGENPGKDEDKYMIPFAAKNGKIIDRWLREYKIKLMSGMMYSVPLIPRNIVGFVRRPTLIEVNYFRPYVQFMLNKYKPTLLILLGNMACMSLMRVFVGTLENQLVPKGKYFITAMRTPTYYWQHGEDGLEDFGKMYGAAIKPLFPDLNIDIPEMETGKTDEEEVKELIEQ